MPLPNTHAVCTRYPRCPHRDTLPLSWCEDPPDDFADCEDEAIVVTQREMSANSDVRSDG